MSILQLFRKKKDATTDGSDPKPVNLAAKFAEAAGSKRAQPYDRQEAIEELCKLGTSEAVEALLKRFTFQIDPSITDQEEKDAAFEGIVAAGREAALAPVRAFAAKAESLSWPMRILAALLPEEELVDELIVWLRRWDTEYAKFVDPKLQILKRLEDYCHPAIREAVEPFLEDVNEEARFNAVGATLAQKDANSVSALLKLLLDEESVRVKGRVADGFVALGWEVADDARDAVRKALPYAYSVDGSGRITKRG